MSTAICLLLDLANKNVSSVDCASTHVLLGLVCLNNVHRVCLNKSEVQWRKARICCRYLRRNRSRVHLQSAASDKIAKAICDLLQNSEVLSLLSENTRVIILYFIHKRSACTFDCANTKVQCTVYNVWWADICFSEKCKIQCNVWKVQCTHNVQIWKVRCPANVWFICKV